MRCCHPTMTKLAALAALAGTVLLAAMSRASAELAGSSVVAGRLDHSFVSLPTAVAAVPLVLLFESSSGSSWLMQLLGSHPQACTVDFEPIDNISLGTPVDHAARLHWLELLWTPQRNNESSWTRWRATL